MCCRDELNGPLMPDRCYVKNMIYQADVHAEGTVCVCVCVYPFIYRFFRIVRSYDLLVQHQYYKVFERD